ncbi:alanine--tRNA ligase [Patescibacteria group bacterium]
MKSSDLREKFIQYFKKLEHTQIPSSSLVPDDDPSVLLTTAGMQQLKDYLTGEKDPIVDFGSQKLISIQKCFRTADIDETGDEIHLTFFEMLGNWSLGNYFKKEAIEYAFDFFTKELKLDPEKLWVTIFEGSDHIPRDEESIRHWIEQGIPKERIKDFGMKDNLWGPVGKTGPCGPSSELHYDLGKEVGKNCKNPNCGPNCACGRFVEIWNLVFMEYRRDEKGNYLKLDQKNVDTGVGFERLLAILDQKHSVYETDLFDWAKDYEGIELSEDYQNKEILRFSRIVCDHIRGAVFLIADGILPARDDRGYILRRIIRRAIKHGDTLKLSAKGGSASGGKDNFLLDLASKVIETYKNIYPELGANQELILKALQEENQKFRKTLKSGMKFFNQYVDEVISKKETGDEKLILDGKEVFRLYETYGFPLELTEELAKEKGWEVDKEGFKKAFKKHQKISRAGVKKKFGGVGEWGDKVAPQHTATHLLHQSLQDVLGKHVKQAGSDLNPERLRFDFTHPEALSKEEIKKIEEIINHKIKDDLPVVKKEMDYKQAIKEGAAGLFKDKYKDKVSVYAIGDYSCEICAGPHVKSTGEIKSFKIKKEKSSSRGVRRIKAIVGE